MLVFTLHLLDDLIVFSVLIRQGLLLGLDQSRITGLLRSWVVLRSILPAGAIRIPYFRFRLRFSLRWRCSFTCRSVIVDLIACFAGTWPHCSVCLLLYGNVAKWHRILRWYPPGGCWCSPLPPRRRFIRGIGIIIVWVIALSRRTSFSVGIEQCLLVSIQSNKWSTELCIPWFLRLVLWLYLSVPKLAALHPGAPHLLVLWCVLIVCVSARYLVLSSFREWAHRAVTYRSSAACTCRTSDSKVSTSGLFNRAGFVRT